MKSTILNYFNLKYVQGALRYFERNNCIEKKFDLRNINGVSLTCNRLKQKEKL